MQSNKTENPTGTAYKENWVSSRLLAYMRGGFSSLVEGFEFELLHENAFLCPDMIFLGHREGPRSDLLQAGNAVLKLSSCSSPFL